MKFVYANPVALTALGFGRDEFLKLSPWQVNTALTKERLKITSINNDQQLTAIPNFTVYHRKDKTTFKVEANTNCFHDNGCNYLIITAIANTKPSESQEEIFANEKRFRALFEHSLDGIALLNKDGFIVDVSPAIEKILGLTKQELVNTDRLDFVVPEHIHIVHKTFKEIMNVHRHSITAEYQAITATGDKRWIECTFTNLLEEPLINVVILNFRDITDQKNAAERNRFKANLLNTTGQAVVAINQHGQIDYWNNAASQMYGWTNEEAMGKYVMELTLAQQTIDEAAQIMQQVTAGKTWSGEFLVQRKDGTKFPAFVTGSPIYNEANVVTGIIGVSSDITALKETENKLKKSEARYKKALEQGKMGHWEMDIKCKKLFWSDEIYKLFNRSPDEGEMDYESFLSYVHPEDKKSVEEAVSACVASGQNYNLVHRIVLKDGTIRYLHEIGNIVKDKYSNNLVLAGMAQDVTEQKLIEKELLTSEQNYKLLFDKNPVPLLMIDLVSLNIVEVNEAAEMQYGYEKKSFTQLNLRDLRLNEDEYLIKEAIASYKKFANQDQIVKHIKSNGDILYVKVTANPIFYNGKEVLLVATRDITNEKIVEKNLKENRKQLSLIFNSTENGMMLLKVENNNQYKLEAVNDSLCKGIGIARAQTVGQFWHEVFDPNRFQHLQNAFDKAVLSGATQKLTARSRLRPGKRISEFTIIPINNEMGAVTKLLLISNDVTDQRSSEEKLRLSEEKYRLLFENSPLPMWIYTITTRKMLEVNNAAIVHYGYTKAEFLSKTLYDIWPQGLAEDFKSKPPVLRPEHFIVDSVHRKKNGDLIKVQVKTNIINYENKRVRLALLIDKTEQEQAKDELIATTEQLRQLASHLQNVREEERTNIAREIHDELGQQLTGIKMDISFINRKIITEDQKITSKLKSSLELIDNTINTVRKIAAELRPSILDDLGLAEAISWQGCEFTKRTGIPVSFNCNCDDQKFSPDISIAIFRIFQEALTNVVRHACATMVVSSLDKQKNFVYLTLKDNGKGFNPGEQQKRKTLGLLGMKERVAILNGKYTIESEAGKGTTISVQIPL